MKQLKKVYRARVDKANFDIGKPAALTRLERNGMINDVITSPVKHITALRSGLVEVETINTIYLVQVSWFGERPELVRYNGETGMLAGDPFLPPTMLIKGEVYQVIHKEIHPWRTDVYLDIGGPFNSVWFDEAEES